MVKNFQEWSVLKFNKVVFNFYILPDIDIDIFHENSLLQMLRNKIFSGYKFRGGSRVAATSKMECFVITIISKHSILNVAAALDLPLKFGKNLQNAESFQL